MTDWRRIRVEGVSDVEREVAVFQVWAVEKVPRAKFKVKVLERSHGGFVAIPNIGVKDKQRGWFDGEAGGGASIEEALEDAVRRLMRLIDEHGATAEDDFEYADPQEF